MKIKYFWFLVFSCCLSCKSQTAEIKQEKFDKVKWATIDGRQYPYRPEMIDDLMASYELHGLKRAAILDLLGTPNRTDSNYLFYTVTRRYLGNTSFTLHTKTLVIKFKADSTVEWRKIHE